MNWTGKCVAHRLGWEVELLHIQAAVNPGGSKEAWRVLAYVHKDLALLTPGSVYKDQP